MKHRMWQKANLPEMQMNETKLNEGYEAKDVDLSNETKGAHNCTEHCALVDKILFHRDIG